METTASNLDNYPIKTKHKTVNCDQPKIRSASSDKLEENGFSNLSGKTFRNDAIRAWNQSQLEIKECVSGFAAKTQFFCKNSTSLKLTSIAQNGVLCTWFDKLFPL